MIRDKSVRRDMPGTFIVSLDFELFWGMQDAHTLDSYRDHVLGGRKAVPELLRLFREYGIHATWAVVGFMMAENEGQLMSYFPSEEKRPSYKNPALSTYRCFGFIGRSEETAPCFYAPSLIRMVADTPGMEIGCHTFSHFYCREEGQTPEQFEADLESFHALAKNRGYDVTSIILPRNHSRDDYMEIIDRQGFTAYRDEENDWIHKLRNRKLLRLFRLADVYVPLTGQGGYVPHKEGNVWFLTGSRMYKPYFERLGALESIKLHRIKKQMLHAARKGLTFHFWWHPHNIGVFTEYHLGQIREILDYYSYLKEKYGMQSMNMREAAAFMEEQSRESGEA